MRSHVLLRRHGMLLLLCVVSLCAAGGPAFAQGWLPVSPDELAMTQEPKSPGAPAIYLYRQVDRDDANGQEREYVRIKILTDQGREQANVQIPFNKQMENIRAVEARTIRSDGSIAVFNGTVYETPIVSSSSVKVLAKTFTLPEVEVGSIIEYRFTRRFVPNYVFNSRWILSQPLFTRYAKFSLLPYARLAMTWSWPRGLPQGTEAPKKSSDSIRMECHDIPAFVNEEFMPPENEMKYRVDFIYMDPTQVTSNDANAFWKRYAQRQFNVSTALLGKPSVALQAVSQIVSPEDSSEAKLRKLYARTQQIHNVSYDETKTDAEQQRDDQAQTHNVEDALVHGRGTSFQINLVFLSLARAAGFQADLAYLATRDNYFLDIRLMNERPLDSTVVIVNVDGQDRFFSPGTEFTPFGLLPWYATGVHALRVAKDGGTWVVTPVPSPSTSRIERRATVTLDHGTLRGQVTVTYTGLEAQWRRSEQRSEDVTTRTKFLEDSLRWSVPSGINVQLTNTPDWDGYDTPLVAVYDFDIPGWATYAGQRALMPVGVFSSEERHIFEHGARVQPLYFHFPYQHDDDVIVQLPAGLRPTSLPKAQNVDIRAFALSTTVEDNLSAVHFQRKLSLDATVLDPRVYAQVRDFFQTVRSADEEQVVLAPGASPAVH